MHIRNPVEWGVDQIRVAGSTIERIGSRTHDTPAPAVRRITVADLGDALARGIDDFAAFRTDVAFLAIVYPLVGLVLARLAFGYGLLPLLFPLASGFALIGPAAAVGLYEMSRRREAGAQAGWADAFEIVREPSFGSIVAFGLMLLMVFLVWLYVAISIYDLTLGPEPPVSAVGFCARRVHDRCRLDDDRGRRRHRVPVRRGGAGDQRRFGAADARPRRRAAHAIGTSLRAVMANPGPMAAWGLVVALALVLGSIPLFLGLIVVMPVLGHATWHLYRRVVAPG